MTVALVLGWYFLFIGFTGVALGVSDYLDAVEKQKRKKAASLLDPLQVEALLELDIEFPEAKVFPITDIETGRPFTGI